MTSNPPQLKGTATPLNLVGWFTWWKSTQREQFLYNVYLYELNKLGTVEIEHKNYRRLFYKHWFRKKFIDEFSEFTPKNLDLPSRQSLDLMGEPKSISYDVDRRLSIILKNEGNIMSNFFENSRKKLI